MSFVKNVAVTGFPFCMVNSADGTAATGKTVTCKINKDGAGQNTATNAVAEVAGGEYKIDFTQAEFNATVIGLLFTATGCIPVHFTIKTVAANVDNTTSLGLTNLDATVSSRLATSGYTTPPTTAQIATAIFTDLTSSSDFSTTSSFGKLIKDNLDTNVGSRLATSGYTAPPTAASIVTTMFQDLTSSSDFTTANSIGKLFVDNINATISSRSTYAGGDTSGTTTLLARLTSGRATNLDNLDAAISTRLATSGYTTPPTAASIVTTIFQDLTSTSDFTTANSIGKLLVDNIDAAISTRLATSGYTTPPTTAAIATAVLTDTTGSDLATSGSLGYIIGHAPSWYTAPVDVSANVSAIKTQTDKMLFDGSNFIKSVQQGSIPITGTVVLDAAQPNYAPAKAGDAMALTAGTVTSFWHNLTSSSDFTTANSIGKLFVDNIDAAISSRSTYAGADTSGTTTLLGRLTSGRATNLDNLDAAISSRSTYAGADTSGTITLLARLTAPRASNLDNLDATISSRSTYAGTDTPGTTTLLTQVSGLTATMVTSLLTGLTSGSNFQTAGSLGALFVRQLADPVTGKSMPQIARYTQAVVSGTITDAGTGTETFHDAAGVIAVTVTVDGSGNRSSVIYA